VAASAFATGVDGFVGVFHWPEVCSGDRGRSLIGHASGGNMQWNMALGIPALDPDEIEYPSSDGQPLAETSVHAEAMAQAFFVLDRFFKDRADVNVGMNLLFYYEKGNAAARFSPDVYVSVGAPKGPRRVYKIWEEPVPPTFVLEVSSRGTWLEDSGNKQALCASLGVREYFLFDPEADYLDPPLQGYRLEGKHYVPIAADATGALFSAALGVLLQPELPLLRFLDARSSGRLPFHDELHDRIELEEARIQQLEAELAELRAKVRG
jgi:Uma2 family endonuclease